MLDVRVNMTRAKSKNSSVLREKSVTGKTTDGKVTLEEW